MTTKKPATALPWVARKSPDGRPSMTIYGADEVGKPAMLPIADCFDGHHAYIVHSANAYPKLVARVKELNPSDPLLKELGE